MVGVSNKVSKLPVKLQQIDLLAVDPRSSEDVGSADVSLVLQARTGSTRLPSKALLPVVDSQGQEISLLRYLLRRLKCTSGVGRFILATTKKREDDLLVKIGGDEGFFVVRGDEEDVLSRFCDAVRQFSIKSLIRVTGDCPLLDPWLLAKAVSVYSSNPTVDYVSNTLTRTFPRGLDFEIVRAERLLELEAAQPSRAEREHVTLGLFNEQRNRDQQWQMINLYQKQSYASWRLTVDELADYLLVREVIETLEREKREWHLPELYDLLDRKYYWRAINVHVRQKPA